MRGTRKRPRLDCHQGRIIPAYAGNTTLVDVWLKPVEDHPRVCGEHWGYEGERMDSTGSSPRMRGTRSYRHAGRDADGIIPAYAGNTRPHQRWRNAPRDHPRVCGEHPGVMAKCDTPGGSSPRMRGTRAVRLSCCSCDGIIPAYAGNTWHQSYCDVPFGDHPRVCGEHVTVGVLM